MTRPQKSFRIERQAHPAGEQAAGPGAVLREIRALRALVEPQEALSRRVLDALRRDMADAGEMKAELDAVQRAIEETKREIASVHVNGFQGPQMARVAGELDAVVQDTFDATDAILRAAEAIERNAAMLEASCRSSRDRQSAAGVREEVVRIYEACNFQDLTGQRITRVVGTLGFIEDRIARMIAIWGGIEAFQAAIDGHEPGGRDEDGLLNGPRLATDAGHASQDEIDALFD